MKIKRLLMSLLVLCVMITSCQKDTYRNEDDTKEKKATIKDYRSYFYNVVRKQQQAVVMQGNVLSNEHENIKVYPNWEKAMLSETDNYELLEIPVFHGNEGFLLYNFEKSGKKSTVIDETVVHSVFKRLVMYKNKAGVIKERILTYIPDKTYLEKNGPDISRNRINKLDKNFSGYIEYSDINKNRLFVLLLKNGKAVLKKQFKNKKTTTNKSNTVMSSVWCGEECYDYYEWQCAGTADDPTEYGCTDPEITDSWCDPIYCDDDPWGDDDPCLDPANMNTAMCGDDDGGGGGGGPTNPPCGYSYKKGVRVANDCNVSSPTVEQINAQIANKPFGLLNDVPCNIIEKWIATAQHEVAQAQINKLNTIASYSSIPGAGSPTIIAYNVATVQNINDAYSTVVNLDYFPVTVSQLPIINGVRATPEQFLEHIRKNINSFVDTYYSEFIPYHWYGINDDNLWNSSNPLGAVIAIDIAGPDNGSVIVSHSSSDKWTFTTIYDPKYGEHPVSGNRDFGYIDNGNGSYTFYTRGVDRLTSWDGEFARENANNYPFNQADALWTSFQGLVSSFVNNHGGNSSVSQNQVQRPNWSDIKDVVDGVKPLSYLNNSCN